MPDVYEQVSGQFSPEEIVALTLAVVAINGWNASPWGCDHRSAATTARRPRADAPAPPVSHGPYWPCRRQPATACAARTTRARVRAAIRPREETGGAPAPADGSGHTGTGGFGTARRSAPQPGHCPCLHHARGCQHDQQAGQDGRGFDGARPGGRRPHQGQSRPDRGQERDRAHDSVASADGSEQHDLGWHVQHLAGRVGDHRQADEATHPDGCCEQLDRHQRHACCQHLRCLLTHGRQRDLYI